MACLPPKPKPPAKKERLIKSIVLAPKDRTKHGVEPVTKKLEFDPDRPLKDALQSVFNIGGKVILALPGYSYEQVSIKHVCS